jgi:Arc/MetJ-type ribon-helix-helix transcriptional regulator
MGAVPHESSGEEPVPRGVEERLQSLAELLYGAEEATRPEGDHVGNVYSLGRARKVSVSLPEGLTSAVQQRVGKGEFSRYVTEAVARQLELDLLAELSELLEAEHGPVPEEYIREAEDAWPDGE